MHARTLGLQGTLRGYDQKENIILDDCHERVYSTKVCYWHPCRFVHPAASRLQALNLNAATATTTANATASTARVALRAV